MAREQLSRRSRRSRDEDEDEFDPTPDESGAIGRYDDEDEEPPRRRRGRSRRDDDEDEEPRRRSSRRSSRRDENDDDEDEDDEPRSRRSSRSERGSQRPSANASGKGWKAFKQKREERSDYVKTYKLPEKDKEIIKILDDEPFSVYAEHWLDERQGKKSFVCISDDCPLCNVGDKPRVYAMFNVVDLRDDPVVMPWKVSQTVADVLEGYANDKKTSPINRDDLYFSVIKTGGGKKGRVQTNLSPVKARDLAEDWDIEPLTAAEIAKFDLFEEDDVIEFQSRKDLKRVADDLDD